MKFVPASGAASRMFKELFEFVNDNKRGAGVDIVLKNIEKFAFSDELKKYIKKGGDDKEIIGNIVEKGLAYGSKPKGLILFHRYAEECRTALEEHLCEGAQYASSCGEVNIHFTVSPEHMELFNSLVERVKEKYEQRFGVKYNISFSVQKASTDTIAVTPENEPFRTDSGYLCVRRGGQVS